MRKTLLLSFTLPFALITGNAATSIQVKFGKPTTILSLYYQKMYAKKPYHNADVYLYNNGMYKIITPGENHYGAYVATGNIKTDRKYTIYFMALPSKDWGSKTAYLKLNFDRHKLTFTQTMVLFNNTSKVPDEYGKYKILINKVANPVSLKWPAKK